MISPNIELKAPAKLNLFLSIIGRRDDGYHLIQSVMQFLDYCDVVRMSLHASPEIVFSSNYQAIDPHDNLVYRAAKSLQQMTGATSGVAIELEKVLPVGAGLGGGSSDCASTLIGLNHLWNLQLTVDQLAEVGLRLGADVPFFVRGHAAWVEGIGEQLTPIDLPERWFVLALPDCHVSTATIYQDPRLTRNCSAITIDDYQPGDGANVFSEIVQADYPPVAAALSWLGQFADARMTGTGAAVFAKFDTEEEAGRIAAQAPEGIRCVVAKGHNKSPAYWGVAKR